MMSSGRPDRPAGGTASYRPAVLIGLVCAFFLSPGARAEVKQLEWKSSTQLLWGDDWMGEEQSIVAQYVRFDYKPAGRALSVAGYGRAWQNFTDSEIRDDGLSGRLYYLYMNYLPSEKLSVRLGRQFVNFAAGSALMDGISLNLSPVGPVGITFAEGSDIRLSLDGTHSKLSDHFIGVNVHFRKIRATQLGFSYVRRYDDWDLAKEEFGLNFRRVWTRFSPYAEVRYDWLSETFDEVVLGLDLFPVMNLMIKGEYYQSYPTFDSTSIYSVFAADQYREYLVRADYSLEAPLTLFASYTLQTYDGGDDADVYAVGVEVYPTNRWTLKATMDRRTGYGGDDWGFEAGLDYKVRDRLNAAAGAQYNVYKRPSDTEDRSATRYWLAGRWQIRKDLFLTVRMEDNINENFKHRPLGRLVLDWGI